LEINMRTKANENGQVIALLAVSMVVFLGFAALALDGGMIYADRRDAQNGADSASFAGGAAASTTMEALGVYYAIFDCSEFDTSGKEMQQVHSSILTAAIGRAGSNNYTIDSDISDDHGVVATCVDNVNMGAYVDKYIDINTIITRSSNTSLMHFVYSGQVEGTVDTVVRIRPRTPMAFGHAVVGLNDAACGGKNGVVLSGSSITNINGGGIYSNGCLNCNGGFDATVTGGFVNYAGETDCNAGHDVSPAPQKTSSLPASSFNAIEPDCSAVPDHSSTSIGDGTYSPGVYKEIKMSGNSDSVILQPGLYCLERSPKAINISGGTITGDGVTIFIKSTAGDINISGAVVDLKAPSANPDPSPAISGMLIYLQAGNTNEVLLTGNGSTYFEGTIYAPDGDIVATGSHGTNPTFNTQLVGWNVDVGGNATVDINFNGAENYGQPPKLDLQE
jgi:hypothetical protein